MIQAILVTGGAGYIGSHTALYLTQQGYKVIILDDYSQQQDFAPTWPEKIIKADFADEQVLHQIFTSYKILAIMHFAGSTEVGLSVTSPLNFYDNNVAKTIKLIKIALDHGVNKIIFSSSCAVYGIPEFLPLTEDHPCHPISPYGQTKLMVEQVLRDCAQAYNLKYVILRYFNAAGALPEYNLFEQHTPETHLIPLLFRAIVNQANINQVNASRASANQVNYNQANFKIFGHDYDTVDGSCVRDYLHVWDLAAAHYLAFVHLQNNLPSDIFNLGTGHGYSVLQIVQAVERVTGVSLKVELVDRRAGDPAVLVADASRARDILKWAPQILELDFMLKSVWAGYMANGR
ncbi:MAG TPA: UDP-glucose 4-epimerase GalE [Candidatus Babeliales bacterium]|nr:UDP-glucose 4-epimerase GalE [Candidatus Babeliales bacterium]